MQTMAILFWSAQASAVAGRATELLGCFGAKSAVSPSFNFDQTWPKHTRFFTVKVFAFGNNWNRNKVAHKSICISFPINHPQYDVIRVAMPHNTFWIIPGNALANPEHVPWNSPCDTCTFAKKKKNLSMTSAQSTADVIRHHELLLCSAVCI